MPKRSWWEGTKMSIKFCDIPMFMRVSQIRQSMYARRSRRHRLDSIISMESLRTSEGVIQSSSKVERVPTIKVFGDSYAERSSC